MIKRVFLDNVELWVQILALVPVISFLLYALIYCPRLSIVREEDVVQHIRIVCSDTGTLKESIVCKDYTIGNGLLGGGIVTISWIDSSGSLHIRQLQRGEEYIED